MNTEKYLKLTESPDSPLAPRPAGRDRTIDVAKGCGILLVIFGHVCHLHPYWSIIYSFHMPLFFLIAGINFHAGNYPSFGALFRKKLRTMLLPYLFFCAFGIACSLVTKLLTKTPPQEILEYLLKLPYAVIWMPCSEYAQLFNTPLWFVPCLTLLEFLYYWLNRIRSSWLFWLAVFAVTFLGWLTERPESSVDFTFLPWNFSTACFALIYFAAGNRGACLIKKHLLEPKPAGKRAFVLIAVFLAAFLITGYVGAHNSGSFGSRVLKNGFLYILTGFTGSLCVLIFSRFARNSRILGFYGKNSFPVMGFQVPLFWITSRLLRYFHTHLSERIPLYEETSVFQCAAMFLFIALLCAGFTILYNRGRLLLRAGKAPRS